MKQVFQSIPLTFFSRAFYWDLVQRWKGVGMGFFLILILLDMGYFGYGFFMHGRPFLNAIPQMAETLPAATFKNHTLSIDQPSPFVVKWPEDPTGTMKDIAGKTIAVIDTNYIVSDLALLQKKMMDEKIYFFVTAEQMIILKERESKIEVSNFKEMPDRVITHENWVEYANILMWWVVPFALFVWLFICAIGNFIKILVGAVFSMIAGLFTKSVPDFAAAMRLAAAASIPAAVAFIVLPAGFAWIRWLVLLGYIGFGAWAAKGPSDAPKVTV